MRKLLTSVYTGSGDKRQENQDSVLCRTGKIGRHTVGLFVVADGAGGMANGAQISSLVTACFSRLWNEALPDLLSKRHVQAIEINSMLDNEFESINCEALDFCRQTGSKGGSTIALLLIVDARYYVKNVGDSRVYRVRHRIRQLTQDQTLTADMVRAGELSAKEATNHKKRHVLSMCIGYSGRLRIFSATGRVCRCDDFIVCCDGLYNCITDKNMKRFLRIQRSREFDEAALGMRAMIERGCAKDNVSVILVRCKGWYW